MPHATLYLPTRRACRLARDLFLDVTGADAAILPRIVPIGDIDEDELVFADAATASALDLPDELGGLERRLLLTQLVSKWAASEAIRREGSAPLVANNPASALALADALARLMDDMTTRQVPWDKLDTLVPERARRILAAHAAIPERDRARARGRRSSPSAARSSPPRGATC